MVSLLDIAPPEASAKEVTVRGVTLRIQGIGAGEWARLYARFPDLARAIEGKPIENSALTSTLSMQAAVIAAGCGHPGVAEIERAAIANLTIAEAGELMQEIIRLSLPGDVAGPLLDAAGAGPSPGAQTAATSSLKP